MTEETIMSSISREEPVALAPCPGCRSAAVTNEPLNAVHCSSPTCGWQVRWWPDEPIENAIAAWNTRALSPDERLIEALERIQDEARTVGGDWRETASMIDSICIAALSTTKADQ